MSSQDRDLLEDRALALPEQDRFFRAPFAQTLARAILTIETDESFVLALHGTWGSGKSTVLNFVEFYLKHPRLLDQDSEPPVVVEFNPWCFSGTEQLFQQFFTSFRTALGKQKEFANTLKTISKHLDTLSRALTPLKWIPGIATQATAVRDSVRDIQEAAESAAKLFEVDISKTKADIRAALHQSNSRFVVLIDDIDRLRPEEMVQVFQLIKAVADFPRTLYILTFDRMAVKRALRSVRMDEPDEYLEKIVQAPFDLPDPDPFMTRRLLEEQLRLMFESAPRELWSEEAWTELFDGGIEKLVRTPRELKRLLNILRFSYPTVRMEVFFPDYVALNAVRLAVPDLYDFLAVNRELMTTAYSYMGDTSRTESKKIFERLLASAAEGERPAVDAVMRRMFPAWHWILEGNAGWFAPDDASEAKDRRLRRIRTYDAFETYFRLSVLPSSVSAGDMRAFVSMLPDPDATTTYLVQLSQRIDADGERRLEKVLLAWKDYIEDVSIEWIPGIVSALLTCGDDLCATGTFQSYRYCDTLLVDILLALTRAYPADRRLVLLKEPFETHKSLSIMAAFYREMEQKRYDPLVEAGTQALQDLLLQRFRTAAADGQFESLPMLLDVLTTWNSLQPGSGTEYAARLAQSSDGFCRLIASAVHTGGAPKSDRMGSQLSALRNLLGSGPPAIDESCHLLLQGGSQPLDDAGRGTLEKFLAVWTAREMPKRRKS